VADTGAPWFIPFAEPTDLVRDWPDLSEDVADAVAAGLSAAGNAGIGPNVVQAVKTDTQSSSVGQGATAAVSGLSVAITPSSTSSLVFVMYVVNLGAGSSVATMVTLRRNTTPIFVADAAGSRQRTSSGSYISDFRGQQANTAFFVDSPASDTAVTYDLLVSHTLDSTETVLINRGSNDSNSNRNVRSASSIIAIEVAV